MIFKTFDSDIDKISAKWGIWGKSFNDIGSAIVGRIKDINKGFQATDDLLGSFKDTNSILKRLYPSKKTIQSKMIDVDTLYPEKTDAQFTKLLSTLTQQQNVINTTKGSWTDYFKNLGEGEKWQIEFVQNTDLQKASLDDVKKAYNAARDGAIAHNTALKQQTLSAKAGQVVLKGLSMAGNMLAGALISFAVSKMVEGIYNLVTADERAIEASENAKSAISDLKKELKENSETAKEAGQEYAELAQGINQIDNTNLSLSTDEYEKFLDLSNQLAELFPTLIRGYDDQGNAILDLSGNMDEINEKIQTQIDQKKELNSLEQYQVFMGEGIDENGEEREEGYYTGAKTKVDKIATDKKDTQDQITELQNRKNYFVSGTQENSALKRVISNEDGRSWREKREAVARALSGKIDSLGLNYQETTEFEGMVREFKESDEEFTEESLSKISEFLSERIYEKQQNLNGYDASLKQQNAEISQNAQVVLERSLGYDKLDDTLIRET